MQGGKDAKKSRGSCVSKRWALGEQTVKFTSKTPANTKEEESLQVLSPSGFLNANGKFC